MFVFKNDVTLKTELGSVKSFEISPFDRAHTTSSIRLPIDVLFNYRLYLVSFLRYSMSKNIVTLKSGSEVTQGH